MKKLADLMILTILILFAFTGCANNAVMSPDADVMQNSANSTEKNIVYENKDYGFKFTLPASWENYKIINGTWEGRSAEAESEKLETGPVISIRHPLWTAENPRQDIPIMVLTIKQWEALQKGEFHIGAAPIGPTELGRNSKYVFALPARYNYAFPEGFEEVEKILQNKPLEPIEK